MTAVARTRTTARRGRWIGTRETSSTVRSSASGGQPALGWLMGFGRACRTLAATLAGTPNVSPSPHRAAVRAPAGAWRWLGEARADVWTVARLRRRTGSATAWAVSTTASGSYGPSNAGSWSARFSAVVAIGIALRPQWNS